MQKQLTRVIILIILSGALSFYAGTKYATKASTATALATDGPGNFQRQGGNGARGNRQMGGGAVSGKILSVTDQSIVVQLRDGGSRIVFISPSTEVSKFVSGTSSDLLAQKDVIVSGESNPDGSLNAKTIQIRPDLPQRFDRGTSSPTQVQ